MKRQLGIVGLSLILVLAGVAGKAAGARADEPIRHTFSVNFTYPQPANTFPNPCAFPVTINEAGTIDATTYFDQNGQPVRRLLRTPQFQWTFTGLHGTALTSSSPASEHLDFVSPGKFVDYIKGMELDFHLPGSGTLFKIAGRSAMSFDFTTQPPTITSLGFSGTFTDDPTQFCSLLSS